jgi:hypothetical protein
MLCSSGRYTGKRVYDSYTSQLNITYLIQPSTLSAELFHFPYKTQNILYRNNLLFRGLFDPRDENKVPGYSRL